MTDDVIRDSYKDDDLKELEQLYYKVDAEVEKNKGRRVILLCIGFFIAYFILFWAIDQPDSFAAVFGTFLVALFLSPVHTYIHILIFSLFVHKQQEENDRRELVLKRIRFAKERESRNTPYYQGWSAGYDTGYDKGYEEGYTSGNKVGNHEGYEDGYDEGLDLGYKSGYNFGYLEGYDNGYDIALVDFGYDDDEGEVDADA